MKAKMNDNRHCGMCKVKLTELNAYFTKSGSMAGVCKGCNTDLSYINRWSTQPDEVINKHIESLVHKIGLLNNIKYKREVEKGTEC